MTVITRPETINPPKQVGGPRETVSTGSSRSTSRSVATSFVFLLGVKRGPPR